MKIILVLFAIGISSVISSNILGVFPFPSESHHILGSALLKKLSQHHNVTYLSPFPIKQTVNFTSIELNNMIVFKEKLHNFFRPDLSLIDRFKGFFNILELPKYFFEDPNVINFIKSDSKFDVMIHFGLLDPSIGFAHLFDCPIIGFAPVGGFTTMDDITGNPHPYSYVPNAMLPLTDEMDFFGRLYNVLGDVAIRFLMKNLFGRVTRRGIEEYVRNPADMDELYERVDLVLINSHVSIESPRPYVPSMIQIGGFHVQEPEELPADLRAILDRSDAIYFSFGTNVVVSEIPLERMEAFKKVLGRLPMKVLFKNDRDEMPDAPENFVVRKWFPQRSVLAHRNVKLFVSHGGFGGCTESLYNGVPMVCVPFFGDQPKNCQSAESDGYAVKIDLADVNEESFSRVIDNVLYNEKFIETTKFKSDLYREREINPMDKAVFWVDHVIKHKGAKHLKVKGRNLPFYQYYLLDVFAFIFLLICVTVTFSYYCIKCFLNRLCRRSNKIKTN